MKAHTVTSPEVSPLTPAVAALLNPPTAAVGVIICYCPFPFTADTQAAICPNVTVMQRRLRIPKSVLFQSHCSHQLYFQQHQTFIKLTQTQLQMKANFTRILNMKEFANRLALLNIDQFVNIVFRVCFAAPNWPKINKSM